MDGRSLLLANKWLCRKKSPNEPLCELDVGNLGESLSPVLPPPSATLCFDAKPLLSPLLVKFGSYVGVPIFLSWQGPHASANYLYITLLHHV